jgi:hypothetical protein
MHTGNMLVDEVEFRMLAGGSDPVKSPDDKSNLDGNKMTPNPALDEGHFKEDDCRKIARGLHLRQ